MMLILKPTTFYVMCKLTKVNQKLLPASVK